MMRILRTILLITMYASLLSCRETEEKGINQMIEKINKKCPVLIDSETQLDSIKIVDKKTIKYNYTLIRSNITLIDTHQFYLAMWPGILSTIKISPEMQRLRENKMNVEYQYIDAYGKAIYTFKIGPKDYQ